MKPQPTVNTSLSYTAQAGQCLSDACVAETFGENFVSQRLAGAPARYTFSACRGMRRLDPKDSETGYSYFGARYYESGLSIWLSVDPLADNYPSLSSYVYCANNPLVYIDPDGREKVNALNPNNTKDRTAFYPIRKYTRNRGVIHFWGHGSSEHIKAYDKKLGNSKQYTDPNRFSDFLKENSYIYNINNIEGEESKTSILVLHTCSAGKEGGIAQLLSEDLDLLVIAPTETLNLSSEDGDYKERVKKNGNWNIYYKGKLLDSFSGNSKPLFDNPEETIKHYEQQYQEEIQNNTENN